MKKSEAAKRLQILINKQCELKTKEKRLGKGLVRLRLRIAKEQQKLESISKDLNACEEQNDKLTKQNAKLKNWIESEKKLLEEIQTKIDPNELVSENQKALISNTLMLKQNLLYALTRIFNLHINLDVLPDAVQGFMVCKQEKSCKWIPFSTLASEIVKEDFESFVYDNLQESPYTQQWEKLILGGNVKSDENAIVVKKEIDDT